MLPTATVVAALDHSDDADSVLRAARALRATDVPSSLHVVHVVEAMPEAMRRYLFPYACFGDDHDAIIADLMESGRTVFRQRFQGDKAFEERMLRVVYGSVADRLLDELKELGPDLVVVGASSRPHPEAGVVGGNAARLARRATSPVLIVRKRGRNDYKKIGVALDMSDASAELFARAIELAHLREGTLTPIHVLASSGSLDHLSARKDATQSLDHAAQRRLDQRYQQIWGSLKLPFPVQGEAARIVQKPRLEHGDPGKQLVAVANEAELDLLVLHRCQASMRSGLSLGRVAEYALRHAPCDILVLPPPVQQAEE